MQIQFDERSGVTSVGKHFWFLRHTFGHISPGRYTIFVSTGLKSWCFGQLITDPISSAVYAVVDDFGDLVEVGHA